MARIKPLPRSKRNLFGREINRGELRSRKEDTTKNVEVGLMDVDSAIMYYFTEVIKPEIEENGEKIKVPVLYANAERWASIQRKGFMRDKKNQLITPVVVFKRISIEKDDAIAVDKLDANDPKNFYYFHRKYTKENRYDQFTAKSGLFPTNEIYEVAVPDYITMNYEAIIWTTYIEQMNKLVEKINWSDGSYWGEPNKFKFRSKIDSFNDATEMADGERIIKTTFSFSFRGYLIPESFNDFVNTKKYLTPKQVVIEDEFGLSATSIFQPDSRAQTIRIFGGSRGASLPSLGGATDFIRAISPGYGNAPQDLEITNTYGGTTWYILRGNGIPSSSRDDKAVVNLSTGNSIYAAKTQYFSGSQSSSINSGAGEGIATNPSGAIFQPSLDSSYLLKSGSVDVAVNGWNLVSQTAHQTASVHPADFYISSSLKDIIIVHHRSGSSGIQLKNDDNIVITYQQRIEKT